MIAKLFCTFLLACCLLTGHAFEVGRKYLYEFETHSEQTLTNKGDLIRYKNSKLEVVPTKVLNGTTLQFKITPSNRTADDPPMTKSRWDGLTETFVGEYDKIGQLLKAHIGKNDGKHVVSRKKFLLALFQLHLQPSEDENLILSKRDTLYNVKELIPDNECETLYSINSVAGENSVSTFNLTKIRNYENCSITIIPKYESSPAFFPFSRSQDYHVPWVTRYSTIQYTVKENTIRSIDSHEKLTLTMFGQKSQTTSHVHTKITLISEVNAEEDSPLPDFQVIKLYDPEAPKQVEQNFEEQQMNLTEGKPVDDEDLVTKEALKNPERILDQLDLVVRKIVNESNRKSENESYRQPDDIFFEQASLLSHLNLTQLEDLHAKSLERGDSTLQAFLSAITYTPSNAAFSLMKNLSIAYNNNPLVKSNLLEYLKVIPFQKLQLSTTLLKEYLQLCENLAMFWKTGKDSHGIATSTCYISYSNLLQSHCSPMVQMRLSPACSQANIIEKYVNKLLNSIKTHVTNNDLQTVIMASVSGNAITEEGLNFLLENRNTKNPNTKRSVYTGLLRYAHAKPQKVQNVLLSTLLNRTECHVIRIYAFLGYMKSNPSLSEFRSVARLVTKSDEDIQVGSFIFSFLRNMKKSPNPMFAHFARLAKVAIYDVMKVARKIYDSDVLTSQQRLYSTYDHAFGLGVNSMVSWIMSKRGPLPEVLYLSNSMNINGFTSGGIGLLLEGQYIESGHHSTKQTQPVSSSPKNSAIEKEMAKIFNSTHHYSYEFSTGTRITIMAHGRTIMVAPLMDLLGSKKSLHFSVPIEFEIRTKTESGFCMRHKARNSMFYHMKKGLFDLKLKGNPKPSFSALTDVALLRRSVHKTRTSIHSPLCVHVNGIEAEIRSSAYLPIRANLTANQRSAEVKIELPKEETDLMWYEMDAKRLESGRWGKNGTVNPSLFGRPEKQNQKDVKVRSNEYMKDVVGKGLRTTVKILNSTPRDPSFYQYSLYSEAIRNDDFRLMKLKFDFGAMIVPIAWKLTYLPDSKSSDLTFVFNEPTIVVNEQKRSAVYQVLMKRGEERLAKGELSYAYTTDFLKHEMGLRYHNFLRNIHFCVMKNTTFPRTQWSSYKSLNISLRSEEIATQIEVQSFSEQCNTEDYVKELTLRPDTKTDDATYELEQLRNECQKMGLKIDSIPFCGKLHHNARIIRKIQGLTKISNRPIWAKNFEDRMRNWFTHHYYPYFGYSLEKTEPGMISIEANLTQRYMTIRERDEFGEKILQNVPRLRVLPLISTHSLFDHHDYFSIGSIFRMPHCYVQEDRLKTFDDYKTKFDVKPGCGKVLAMDCSHPNSFIITFSQNQDKSIKKLTVYSSSKSSAFKIEVTRDSVTVNGQTLNLTAGDFAANMTVVTRNDLYTKVSILSGFVKIFVDDIGVYVAASREYTAKLCGICGNMNGCFHDDMGKRHHGHGQGQVAEIDYPLWLLNEEQSNC